LDAAINFENEPNDVLYLFTMYNVYQHSQLAECCSIHHTNMNEL